LCCKSTPSIASALAWAIRQLSQCQTPLLDAEVLLARVLAQSRTYLHTWPERRLEARQWETLRRLIEERAKGTPVAYLTGRREFWSLDLKVNSATLIPRPETELLVELALVRIPAGQGRRVADLGTGSGAIALALASERPACTVVATDRSGPALAVARDNATRLRLTNLEFFQGDWFAPLAGQRFDVIVSNPPYVADDDPHLRVGDVRLEPAWALKAGMDGLDALRHLIEQAPLYLKPNGWLILEHGYDQGLAVYHLLSAGGFTSLRDHADLAGHSRACEAQLCVSAVN
jgi:release factor glutamine methyltransferase